MTKQPHNSTGYQHEALHMAYVFGALVDRELVDHHFCTGNPDLLAKAEAARDALGDLYQAIGAADVADWKPKESE